jgi:2',3'-cyclic-nucleotide 2'-phosphodiesterase (5'-nucleotidase family)
MIVICGFLIALAMGSALLPGCSSQPVSEGTVISVFYSSDTRGKLEGCGCKHNGGGITKRSAKLAAARAEDPDIIYCDAGNFLTGTPENDNSGGIITVDAFNHMHANVANVSERELALGLDKFNAAKQHSKFKYVSANIRADGKPIADDYYIENVKGARIAYLGLCGTKEQMRYDSSKIPANVTISDPMEAARKLIPTLDNKSDILIVLSTCGDATDSLLAETFPSVNVIVGGRTYRANEDQPWIIGDTRIVRAQRDGRTIGRLDMVFGAENKIKTYNATKITMETTDPTDESMLAVIREHIPGFVDNPKDGVKIMREGEKTGEASSDSKTMVQPQLGSTAPSATKLTPGTGTSMASVTDKKAVTTDKKTETK